MSIQANDLWFGSHCGSPRFARWFYKLVNGVLYQKPAAPHSKWIRVSEAKIKYYSDDYIAVEYPETESCAAICFELMRV